MKLLSKADEQRKELAKLLINHVDTNPSRNVQAAAMYIMGRHRLVETVPALIKHIDFETGERPVPSAEPLWERYPAMEALIVIGRPAVLAAVDLLATEDGDLRRTLAVKVVRYAEDSGTAAFILDRARNSEMDPNRKARLGDAVTRLRALPPG
jgi:hypothetical protein